MKMLVCTNKLNLAILHLYLFMTSYLIIFIYYILRDSQNQTNAAILLSLQTKKLFQPIKIVLQRQMSYHKDVHVRSTHFQQKCSEIVSEHFCCERVERRCIIHVVNTPYTIKLCWQYVGNMYDAGASYMLPIKFDRVRRPLWSYKWIMC